MLYSTVEQVGNIAVKKVEYMRQNLPKFFVLSIFAGMFVGFAIMLVFSVAAPYAAVNSPVVKTLMGVSFGVALTLVIFAGSELFTGNNMVMAIGVLEKKVTIIDTLVLWFWCYLGNLVGSVFLAWLYLQSGLISKSPLADLILKVTSAKMNAPTMELFFRGLLCNMLVCLAVWTATRAKEDTAKLLLIWWCLYAFIGSGFEHSIANMTLLSMGLFIPHSATISIAGFWANLIPVTLGNIVGGALFIGAGYWYASKPKKAR